MLLNLLDPFLCLFVVYELSPCDDDLFDLLFLQLVQFLLQFSHLKLLLFKFAFQHHILVFVGLNSADVLVLYSFHLSLFVLNVALLFQNLLIHLGHLVLKAL